MRDINEIEYFQRFNPNWKCSRVNGGLPVQGQAAIRLR
ncbi:hypothetical protein FHW01_003181 [Ochrobactrum sp. RH1CCR134]|nr:hypothetical protein [Ochrobactrum sp. RH1CCR134]